jgi:predicted Zn-dependent protease
MLQRLSQRSGGGLPSWLSTHPDPGDRKARTSTLAHEAVLQKGEATLAVNEESFKRKLEGLVYGDDPRSGYLESNHFYHPDLNFEMDWPNGWKVENSSAAVTGQSPDGKAAIQLTLEDTGEGPDAPGEYVAWIQQKGTISQSAGRNRTIGGAQAWVGHIVVKDQSMALAFIEKGKGVLYQFVGIPGRTDADGRFLNTVESFGPLRDPAKAKVFPNRVTLIKAPGGHSFETIVNQEKNVAAPADELSWLNNLFVKDAPEKGKLLKIVRRGAVAS